MEAGDAEKRVVELEEIPDVPGTYFNPQTEVIVVVDDSTSIDQEIFNMEPYEGADWVRISDEVPVDEEQRDALIEDFQTSYHPAGAATARTDRDLASEDEEEDDVEPPKPAEDIHGEDDAQEESEDAEEQDE